MTDRIRYVTVILDQDYRDDDAATITNAISMIKGVQDVKLGEPVTGNDYFNREVVRRELLSEVHDLILKK